jgi:hypothetical protein
MGMNKQPKTRQLRSLAKGRYVNTVDGLWYQFAAAITNADLQMVVAFSLIGLLLALNFIFRFPDMGAVIAQYNQF